MARLFAYKNGECRIVAKFKALRVFSCAKFVYEICGHTLENVGGLWDIYIVALG